MASGFTVEFCCRRQYCSRRLHRLCKALKFLQPRHHFKLKVILCVCVLPHLRLHPMHFVLQVLEPKHVTEPRFVVCSLSH